LEETAAIFDGDEQQLELASTGGRAVRMASLSYRGSIAVYTRKSPDEDHDDIKHKHKNWSSTGHSSRGVDSYFLFFIISSRVYLQR